jgi:hypothetical protein
MAGGHVEREILFGVEGKVGEEKHQFNLPKQFETIF